MPPRQATDAAVGAAGGASNGTASTSASTIPSSVYPTDSIADVADALGLARLKEPVAAALAADVEYRIRDVVQQAAKFMRHAKRSQLRTVDVDAAFRAKNIEPVYGFLPTSLGKSTNNSASSAFSGPAYRRVQTASGPLHFVDDEEIDFDKVLDAAPRLRLGRGVGWGAHWLAIEGVQPAVPQNPTPSPIAGAGVDAVAQVQRTNGGQASLPFSGGASAPLPESGTPNTPHAHLGTATARPLVKHVLSRELQLYFEKLTSAIIAPPSSADQEEPTKQTEAAAAAAVDAQGDSAMSSASARTAGSPPIVLKVGTTKLGVGSTANTSTTTTLADFATRSSGNTVRDAALSSLRGDPGLHQLVPYLVQWVGERVALALSAPAVESAGQDASTTMVQEELGRMVHVTHALLVNPHLFIEPYLHQILPALLSILLNSSVSPHPTTANSSLRQHAAAVLAHLVSTYAPSYPSLRPRVVRTLLGALLAGTRDAIEDKSEESQAAAAAVQDSADVEGARDAFGTKLGALIGLRRLGAGAIRALALGPGGVELLRRRSRRRVERDEGEDTAMGPGDGNAVGDGAEEEEREFRDKVPLARLGRWVEDTRDAGGEAAQGVRLIVEECTLALRSLSTTTTAGSSSASAALTSTDRALLDRLYGPEWVSLTTADEAEAGEDKAGQQRLSAAKALRDLVRTAEGAQDEGM